MDTFSSWKNQQESGRQKGGAEFGNTKAKIGCQNQETGFCKNDDQLEVY